LSNRAKALGIQPRKSLGQNFLSDPGICSRIVDAAEISADDLVIEIGPGLGALTRLLANRARQVIAIEVDQTLIPHLRDELGATKNVEIIHADALAVNYAELAAGQPVRFVANLPYYITSHAIRTMLESGVDWRSIVLTVQLEVAQRIAASPPDMSMLAVSVQFYGRPELLFKLPGALFYPPPDVDSATIRIVRTADFQQVAAYAFFRMVRAAFSQPRKQLRNTIASGLGISKAAAEDILIKSGITPERRAETLSLDEWVRLVQNTDP
jgi:16S rRNA (adenine1518-N6/adenine1519-N6)-dimethyltransferase